MKNNKFILIPIIFICLIFITICISAISRCAKSQYIYFDEVMEYSSKYDIEPQLVFAIIKQESNFDKDAISNANAVGLMQILPNTSQYIAKLINYDQEIDLKNAKTNIMFGCAYIRYLQDKFSTQVEVLCAYNAGEGNVLKWLNSEVCSFDGKTLFYIPFDETRNYVEKVLRYKRQFKTMIS